MREQLQKLKKTSNEFRDLMSYLYRTTVTDGKVHLIKFRNYIHTNEIIKEIIKPFIDDTVNLDEFVLRGSNRLYISFNKPVEDELLYKFIIKYVDELSNNDVSLDAEFTYYKRINKFNDAIQSAIKDAIDPLFRYISRELISKIEEIEQKLEAEKKPGDVYLGDVAKDGGVFKKAGNDFTESNNNSTNNAGGDIIQGDKNKTIKKQHF